MPTLTNPVWQRKLHEHEHKCYYCGAVRFDLIQEHKMPRSRGGSDDPTNIVPACRECNMSKYDLTEQEFQEYRQTGIRPGAKVPEIVAPVALLPNDGTRMTLPEAAVLLGRTRARVWQYVKEGTLPARKIGRDYIVKRDDVLKLKANPRPRGRPRQPKGESTDAP